MKLKEEDKALLKELCIQYNVSYEMMLKLLDATKEFEFRERRAGIYESLSEIIKGELKTNQA
jgi:hypothetical protein